ncbi:MAG: hypothetical protein H6839_10220 [Planctomycetes bacterium]|nr:hypothetical protein [Planctomycetota bacterium]
MLYFPDENDSEWELYGEDFAELSKMDAMFMKIAYTADREVSPWAEESVVPTSKLLSDNPSREYNVAVGKPAVLVCDWYGNEYFRTDNKVRADKLKLMIAKVADLVDDANKKLQKNLDKAQAAADKENSKDAIKELLKNFKEGVVGLEAQEGSIRLYHEIMDGIRAKKDELVEKGDVDGLKELGKIVKKTELEKEIDEAMEAAKNAAVENPKTQK